MLFMDLLLYFNEKLTALRDLRTLGEDYSQLEFKFTGGLDPDSMLWLDRKKFQLLYFQRSIYQSC